MTKYRVNSELEVDELEDIPKDLEIISIEKI